LFKTAPKRTVPYDGNSAKLKGRHEVLSLSDKMKIIGLVIKGKILQAEVR
jgi:hypothetical protein